MSPLGSDDLRQRLQTALAGNYDIERELGGGGMSRTYLARERAFDRRVVVKVLAPELLAGLSVERFRREVLLAAQLQHPHVVPVLTAGDVDGLPWFTMPYVDGESLRQRLAQGPMGITEVVGILRDTARALAYAHGHGVVHRDIKPDNVLISAGSATVTDFGIAKAISAARTGGEAAKPALTMTGMSIGTPTYMSPEQAAGDPNTDARADLYSFGTMAYELLSGRPPFHGLSPAKLLAAHLGERPEDVRSLRPDCPDALAALVMQCLEKEPDARPHAASDLTRVLDTITSSGAAAAAPSILAGGRIRLGHALGLWAAATTLVSLTAWAAREVIGLPDWTFPGAVGVMLAGLPAILGTWYVQKTVHRTYTTTPQRTPGGGSSVGAQGTMATLALKASPHISWRRTWLGGGIAVGGFALAIIAFMVMRAAGVGPFASLQGAGRFGDRETIVVADFRSPSDDPSLGPIAAEAVRTDLAQSSSLDILSRAQLREAMARMRRGEDSILPFDVARELATREGAKAVLDGGISKLGNSYVLTGRLVSALDGEEMATFRETASGEDDLLPALGRLTKAVRAKTGESLRRVRQTDELSRVTTSSLPALRKYVEGLRQIDETGNYMRGIELLQDAVEIDSSFAMAWRKMAAELNNNGLDPARARAAVEASFRHRDRLTELERLLTEGYYYTNGPRQDPQRALDAYLAASRVPGAGVAGLNNAAVIASRRRDYELAEQLGRRVIAGETRFANAWTNLLGALMDNGKIEAMDSVRQDMRQKFPNSERLWLADLMVARGHNRFDVMDSIARSVAASNGSASQRIMAFGASAGVARTRGRPEESERWSARRAELITAGRPNPAIQLGLKLQHAANQVAVLQRPADARATLARALRDHPPAEMDPAERPWDMILRLATLTGDSALALRAHREAKLLWANLGPDSAGVVAFLDGLLAGARAQWGAMLSRVGEADRLLMIDESESAVWRIVAFDRLGNSDSSLVWLERFTSFIGDNPEPYSLFGAQTHKRLGELYEQRGDRAGAIAQYERFVDLWRDAEPALQPQVRDVQARLTRLRPPG
ncbi:MAG: protein kinase [Gemmatimonadaceae bacterium]|nr:protein kinase [Gemmatimonadaceae bacterium]